MHVGQWSSAISSIWYCMVDAECESVLSLIASTELSLQHSAWNTCMAERAEKKQLVIVGSNENKTWYAVGAVRYSIAHVNNTPLYISNVSHIVCDIFPCLKAPRALKDNASGASWTDCFDNKHWQAKSKLLLNVFVMINNHKTMLSIRNQFIICTTENSNHHSSLWTRFIFSFWLLDEHIDFACQTHQT